MEITYYIIIPIVTSILSGLVGGLFTFLGVLLTIKNEKKHHEEELRLKTKEKNKSIIDNRPILQSVEIPDKKSTVRQSVYIVPFGTPELIDKKNIIFHYPNGFENESNWKYYTIFLKNIGTKRIVRSFLHTNYENKINLYTDIEINNWNEALYARHFFLNSIIISCNLAPSEILELKIYHPKDSLQYKNAIIDIYFEDEYGNKWVQYFINNKSNDTSLFDVVSNLKYSTYIKKDMETFFLYSDMYYNKNIKRTFKHNKDEIEKYILTQALFWQKIEDKIETTERDYKNGYIELKDTFRSF